MRGEPLQGQGCGDIELDTGRHDDRAVGRHGEQFGVGSGALSRAHAVAHLQTRDAFAERLDDSGSLRTRSERQVHGVAAAALIGLDEVEPRGVRAHEHLAGSRGGRRSIRRLQHLVPAGLGHDDREHETS